MRPLASEIWLDAADAPDVVAIGECNSGEHQSVPGLLPVLDLPVLPVTPFAPQATQEGI
jgi:hypothetical protein